ncbi:unnamed protein product, partial [Natator depressus]
RMEKALSLLVLLALSPCVRSQIQLAQSGPGVVKPGEPLTQTCAVSGYTISSGYYWAWIRQVPGKGLEYLGYVFAASESTNYAPSLQGRVTISADTAKNQVPL